MTGNLTRMLACALAFAGLAAPAGTSAHEGEDHAKKPAADAPAETPADAPKAADPAAKGVDAERRAATRRRLADEAAAKQKEAAGNETPLPPSGAPPGIGPK